MKASLAASPRKDSTKSLYDSLLSTHVIGQPVGAIALDRLKPTDIEAMIVGLRSGMASSTVYKVFMVLRLSLDDAVRDGLLAVNPMQKVRPPAIESEEVRHLSADEVGLLFTALQGSQYEAIVRLLAFSGLRKGEAIGLRWVDVDFDRRTFKVVLTLSGFGPTEPKTKKSRRTLEMSEYLTTLLETQRMKQLEDRVRAADVWTETGYVFTSETGTPLDPRNTLRAVTKAGEKAGLGHLNVHTLRHSVATMLLEAGVHDKAVADILGHSDTRMTARYAHTSDRYAREAMSGLAAALNSVAAPVAANPPETPEEPPLNYYESGSHRG